MKETEFASPEPEDDGAPDQVPGKVLPEHPIGWGGVRPVGKRESGRRLAQQVLVAQIRPCQTSRGFKDFDLTVRTRIWS